MTAPHAITDARWSPRANVLEFACGAFNRPWYQNADEWRVTCPHCGARGQLDVLRQRWLQAPLWRRTGLRLLVCGGRQYSDRAALWAALDAIQAGDGVRVLIEGGQRGRKDAPGADWLAARWAGARGVPLFTYPADWCRHGKAAGPLRNEQMICAGQPDLVLAAPGGAGTADMVNKARKHGVQVQRV